MDPSSDPYRRIIEQFPDGIVFLYDELDGELQYTFVGGEGLDAIGLTKADLEGHPVAEGRPTEVREELRSQYRRALDGERVSFEIEAEGRHFRIQVLPRRDESGAVEGGLGIAQDVTEERVYREELERQNRRLERFTRLVFHDIRNPLMVAQGRIDMLREECASDHVDPVADALDRIETLTREEPTSVIGDDSGELDPVDLGAIAEEAWRNVATKDAELRVGIDRTVRADEGDLRRMFENLYSNAVTHGGERVTVTVGELPGGFFLEDDGRGLPAEIRERAFEHGVSAAESGTGFGLFIVGNVVDAHGWTIDATEGSDGGARFEVTGLDD